MVLLDNVDKINMNRVEMYASEGNPNQNASSRHACHKFATRLRKLAAI